MREARAGSFRTLVVLTLATLGLLLGSLRAPLPPPMPLPGVRSLDVRPFMHLLGPGESEGGMRTYLERELSGADRSEVTAAFQASGWTCLQDTDPRLRAPHVDCAVRIRSRFPTRWAEHWHVQFVFGPDGRVARIRPRRAVLMFEF